MNVKLLLDENLSPTIGMLGVPDHVLLERAFLDDRVLVTCNVDDFIGFARSREIHAGIVLVEEGGLLRDEQLRIVRVAIATLRAERDFVNRVLRIWTDGTTIIEQVPPT